MPTVRQQLAAVARNGLIRPGADPTYADGDDGTWTTIDWVSMTRRVEVFGSDVNLVDSGGDKPAMVFIHGLGGCWQNWLLNLPRFLGTHRVLAPDLPGFGASPMPAGEVSIKGYGKIVDKLCEQLGVDWPVVVGNSMGGFIGAEMALDFPTRVEKLVLVSAAGLSIEHQRRQPLLTLARLWAVNASWVGARGVLVVKRPRLRRAALQFLVRYPEKLSAQLTYELVQGTGKPGFMPALEALMNHSYRDLLSRIEMPVLVVWGENDMLVPVGDAQEYADLIGDNARRIVFDDTGHLPMLERPSRFHDLLEEFVSGDRQPESGVEGVSA